MAVYETYLPPKKRRDTVADIVPWRAIIAPSVVLHKDQYHSLQRSYGVRGPDVVGVDPAVQGALMMQANNGLKRLGGRWMFQSEAQRFGVQALPAVPSNAPPLVRLLDAAYRAHLLAAPGVRETLYYHTLTWTPPAASAQRWTQFFLRGPGATWRNPDPTAASVLTFVEEADMLMDLLKGVLAECGSLSTEDTLTYLHTTVSDDWRRLRLPGSLVDIDHYVCDRALDPSGWYPQLGDWHLRTCSLKAYPRDSIVGMLRALEAQSFDFRWCTRWLGLEKHVQQGILRKAQRAWVHEERSFGDRISENVVHENTRVLNRDATNKAEEVDIARQEIGADVVAYGEFASTVTVWDTDPARADEKRRIVMQVFAAHDIGSVEEGVHQEAAWRSSHPGNRLDNVNSTHQSTLTLAHLTPGLTAAWRGPSRDAYLKGGPWFYAKTDGNTLFRVVNHFYDERSEDFRDLGHFLVLGSTGCHAPGTDILMHDGSLKCVEDIRVGDQVMGPDSLPRQVLRLYGGRTEMARIIPTKGEPFTVTMDHVLSLKRTCRYEGDPLAGRIVNLTVREWFGATPNFRHLHKLYRVGVAFEEGESLAIHPYLLGVLLGDGNIAPHSVRVTNPDEEIRAYINHIIADEPFETSSNASNTSGCPIYGFRHREGRAIERNAHGQYLPDKNKLTLALGALGLLESRSESKFIPHVYKTSSHSARMQLLAALLDTDGSLTHKGYDYISKSLSLAEDVCFVARSLGLAAYLAPCWKCCQTGGGGQYYRVSISGNTEKIPCQVPRKKAQLRQQKKSPLVTGFDVEPVGPGSYYGFESDGDHLYLMGDFTVTHNSGKSTLGNWLRLMWLQYQNSQVKLFDIKRHGKLLTLLLGGTWIDLGDPAWQAQPLRHVDDVRRRRTILQWVLDLLEQYHVPITAPVQKYVGNHLEKLAKFPADNRTFTQYLRLLTEGARKTEEMTMKGRVDGMGVAHVDQHLRDLIQEYMAVRWVLEGFAAGGEHNGIFDGVGEDFDDNPVQTFELDDLLGQTQLLGPVMRYVLPAIEYQMTTDRPMFLLFDDAAIPLEVARIRKDAKGWLRTARKLGASVGFATHSLDDLFGKESPIGEEMASILLESCPVRFYLPNAEASKPNIRAIYHKLGLEDPAIDHIAQMRPRRDVYYELREMGQRPITLHFPRIILDCIARNTAEDHRLIDEILQKEGREGFCEGWLCHHGYEEQLHALA